ncbi:M50 family metallopeptidase [Bacillus salitolerans]|uniref:M50 family metallopeptidase n=1 Tax=Bacillus salitolerans TaxID=1437434 RepID=A0ABW4LLK8_9BACI
MTRNILTLTQKIQIHPLFWFVIGISIITAHFTELLIVFMTVLIHELGHACMAQFFHWRIKKIQLLPFGGVVELDEHGNRPLKEELLVILAGPFQHIWMIGVAFLFVKLQIISAPIFELFIYHNLIILCFNLLPVWPLDGGKLLFLLYSLRMPFTKAHRSMMITSISVILVIIMFTFLFEPYHFNLWIIVLFLLVSLYTEWKQRSFVYVRFLMERYYGKYSKIEKLKPLLVEEGEQVIDVLGKFFRGYKHLIVITEGNKRRELDENELLYEYFARKRTTSRVGDLTQEY